MWNGHLSWSRFYWLLCNLHDLIWNSSVSLEKLCLWLGSIFFHTPYTSLYLNQLCPQLSECLEAFHDMNQNVMALVSMDTRQLSVNTLTQFQSFQKTTLSRPPNCFHQFCNMKGLIIQRLTLLADCTTHVLFKGEYCITWKASCILYPKNHYKDSLNLYIFLMFPQI